MSELWVIGLTGAAVGGALGWPLLRWPTVTTAPDLPVRLLGGLLLGGAVATGLIAAAHSERISPAGTILLQHAVYGGNLLFWAVFTIWMRRATGLATPAVGQVALITAPLTLFAIAAIMLNDPPRFIWLLPAGAIAASYAVWRWLRVKACRSASRQYGVVTRMVAFGVALQIAQTIRTFWPHVDAVREIVPATMTLGFLSFAMFAMRGLLPDSDASDTLRAGTPRYARSALDAASAEQLLHDLERGMRNEKWYCDPNLSLNALAAKAGVRPHAISQALNQVMGRSLTEYLATWRVAEARRLLADPASDRFTIEALAESAGFASRSAFYKTFKALEGVTPSEYRARVRDEVI